MANTTYSEVIELALHILHDYKLDGTIINEDIDTLNKVFAPYIKFAAGELENFDIDFEITNRDDVNYTFDSVLTDGQQLFVAKLMVIGYISREVNDIMQMKLHLQTGDFKTFAERNNLEGKQELLNTLKEEINYKITKRGYKGFNWGQ